MSCSTFIVLTVFKRIDSSSLETASNIVLAIADCLLITRIAFRFRGLVSLRMTSATVFVWFKFCKNSAEFMITLPSSSSWSSFVILLDLRLRIRRFDGLAVPIRLADDIIVE